MDDVAEGALLGPIAHQRLMREREAELDPRAVAASLAGYSVEVISRAAAEPLILRYEWLRTMGQAHTFIGLLSPDRDLQGVAAFGPGPAGDIRKLLGGPALCLERGCCCHYSPPNSASFLISEGCKLVYRLTGITLFHGYGDPHAGEFGSVYQACNWVFLGQGLNGRAGKTRRYFMLPPGADPSDPSVWKSTRCLRRNGQRMTFADATRAGWTIASRSAKFVYAMNYGRDRKAWRKQFPVKPYPAPRPELKRNRSAQFGPPAALSIGLSISQREEGREVVDKVFENRLRRVAKRRQLQLVKIRRMDRLAHDYGMYRILDLNGRVVHSAAGMDGIQEFLLRD